MTTRPQATSVPIVTHALTLIQPWATAIVRCGKDVENRPWAPPESMLGRYIAIHAGVKTDEAARSVLAEHFECMREPLPRAGVIGTARIAGFIRSDRSGELRSNLSDRALYLALASSWCDPDAKVHWVLDEPLAYDVVLPMPGRLGLWALPAERVPHPSLVRLLDGDVVDVTRDRGEVERRRVRLPPWQLGHGCWVVGLEGIHGGYLLTRCARVAGEAELKAGCR